MLGLEGKGLLHTLLFQGPSPLHRPSALRGAAGSASRALSEAEAVTTTRPQGWTRLSPLSSTASVGSLSYVDILSFARTGPVEFELGIPSA